MLSDRLSPNVRLTRRGRSVVAVCLLAVAMAWLAGPRALNAVVAPGLVGLIAAYIQIRSLDSPRVVRSLPPDAHVGSTHELTLRFVDPDDPTAKLEPPFVARVTEPVSGGLELDRSTVETTVGAEPVQLAVRYRRRGEQSLGPTKLAATDVFGLLSREFDCRPVDDVLVYPERRPIPRAFRRGLYALEEVGRSRERDEFDRLREYEEGDALRDIHWPTTARTDQLIVKEFAADARRPSVSISVGGRGADRSAVAATSVALSLLEDGVPVDVSAPNGRVETFPGASHRDLLELLARMSRGQVPDPDADVVIQGTHRRTEVRVDGERYQFDRLHELSDDGRRTEEATPNPLVAGGEQP